MKWLAGLLLMVYAVTASAQAFDHGHKAWTVLLKKHVVLISDGRASQLDYAGMAKDRAALKAYAATSGATASIAQATVVYNTPAPFTASFS